MTIYCRPKGRGNWRLVKVTVDGLLMTPWLVSVGDTFTIAGVLLRVVSIEQ